MLVDARLRCGFVPISAAAHLPPDYSLRLMAERDYSGVSAICAAVYPTERPFVVQHDATAAVAGAHLTLGSFDATGAPSRHREEAESEPGDRHILASFVGRCFFCSVTYWNH
jgi:hypothetical protein